MLTILLNGCGNSSEEESKQLENSESNQVISLKLWGAGTDITLLAQMAESFKAEYADQASFDITIEEVLESDCKIKILNDVNATADVFAFADDQLMELAGAGVIKKIENYESIATANSKGSVEGASIQEELYAYPMTADNGYFMYYNKKYFSEEDVKTLDNMLSVAAKAGKKVTMDWTSGWYLYSFFGNTGLTLNLNYDGITNSCDWNSTTNDIKGVDVGNAMLAIAKNKGFLSAGDDGLVKGAKDGTVIAGVSGIWLANSLEEIWKEDYAAVKLPTYTCAGKQVQMSSFTGYKLVGVNAYSKEKEWAAKLAEWITNEENQKLRFRERGQGPSNINAANSVEVQESLAIQAVIAQSDYGKLQRIGNNYWQPISDFGQQLVNKKISSKNMQAAMDKMVKGITTTITG